MGNPSNPDVRRQLGKNVTGERSDGETFETGDRVQVVGAEVKRVMPEPDRDDGRGEFLLLSLTEEQQGPAIIVHADSVVHAE